MKDWTVRFHSLIDTRLQLFGTAEAEGVLKVIRECIAEGEPDKIGKAMRGPLAGYRRIRTGDVRIVYRINGTEIILGVYVGARRDDEVYDAAVRRV